MGLKTILSLNETWFASKVVTADAKARGIGLQEAYVVASARFRVASVVRKHRYVSRLQEICQSERMGQNNVQLIVH